MKAARSRKTKNAKRGKLPLAVALGVALVIGAFSGMPHDTEDDAGQSSVSHEVATSSDDSDEIQDETPSEQAITQETQSVSESYNSKIASKNKQDSPASYKAHSWSYKKYPLYYKFWGEAVVSSIGKGKVKTSSLDSLGRTREVTAKITYEMVKRSSGFREDLSGITCSGWGNQRKVSVTLSSGKTYSGYGWNRSHLLADSLGGHAVQENIICGTRMQNVGDNSSETPGGMAYTETLARDYLRSHESGWVYYKATPVYKGSELVPRSVYVDIKSDDGSINQHVEVFNAMRGYKVDYKEGTLTPATAKTKRSVTPVASEKEYVYITNSGKKYHSDGCRYLKNSKTKTTLSAAKNLGLTACSVCF